MKRLRNPTIVLASALLTAAGCGFQPQPGMLTLRLDPSSVEALAEAPGKAQELEALLVKHFGTRAGPRYELLEGWTKEGVDPNHPERELTGGARAEFSPERWAQIVADNRQRLAYEIAHASGAEEQARLANRYPSLVVSAELYRVECLHCHGTEGGGDGETGRTLNPKPRDFRKGIFKYTAVKDQAHPRREDLNEILERGIDGTAMPSFARLSLAEREGLVDYVRLLALRGEVEALLVAGFKDEEAIDEATAADAIDTVWGRWERAKDKLVAFAGEIPADTPERRARGRELFLDEKKGNCVSCHGPEGHGDGPAVFKTNARGERTPAYQDAWGFDILPRDLTAGVFHGGSRPIDIYRRIYAGINGTPMPGIGEAKDAEGQPLLTNDDLWSIVHYVRSLSARAP